MSVKTDRQIYNNQLCLRFIFTVAVKNIQKFQKLYGQIIDTVNELHGLKLQIKLSFGSNHHCKK